MHWQDDPYNVFRSLATFSVPSSSQDAVHPVQPALMSTYNKEYTGTFGPPAPDARYKLITCYKQTFSCFLHSHSSGIIFFGPRVLPATDPSTIALGKHCYRACPRVLNSSSYSIEMLANLMVLNDTFLCSHTWLSK